MLVVLDDARDGASNLAIDEALLEAEGSWLRFYAWTPATISLGYFQRFEDFADVEGRYPIVRRCTGGGAILHARELTFSIAGPEALLPRQIEDSYARFNRVIADTAASFGRRLEPAREVQTHSRWCFAAPRGLDLLDSAGAKAVGSAQRRRAGRFLHHGSIVLEAPPGQAWCGQIALPSEALATALGEHIPAALSLEPEVLGALPPAIQERADALRASRYSTDAWQRRR